MSNFTTTSCFGCDTELRGEVGLYYCDSCVEKQLAEQRKALAAFDAYHKFADSKLKESR